MEESGEEWGGGGEEVEGEEVEKMETTRPHL